MYQIFAIFLLSFSCTRAFRPSSFNSTAKWIDTLNITYDNLVPVLTSDGYIYYIGRTYQQGSVIPGSVVQSTLHYSFQAKIQKTKFDFEVLVFPYSDFSWVEIKNISEQNRFPENTFVAGYDRRTDEDLFVCRTWHLNGTKQRIGKVSMREKSCNITEGWIEHSYNHFDVLAYTPLKLIECGTIKELNWHLIGLIVCAVLIPIAGLIGFVSGRKCFRKSGFERVSTT